MAVVENQKLWKEFGSQLEVVLKLEVIRERTYLRSMPRIEAKRTANSKGEPLMSYNPSDHLRNPKETPQGGQFTQKAGVGGDDDLTGVRARSLPPL